MINSTPSFDFELTDGQFEKRSEKIKAAPPVELGLVGNFTPEQFEEISAKLKLAHIFFERMEWLNATACYNYLVSDVEGGFAPSAYGRLALTGTKDPKIDPSDIVRLANKSMRAQPKEASAYLAIAILACRIDNAYYASRWIQLAELAGGMPESIMDLVKSDIKYAIESGMC